MQTIKHRLHEKLPTDTAPPPRPPRNEHLLTRALLALLALLLPLFSASGLVLARDTATFSGSDEWALLTRTNSQSSYAAFVSDMAGRARERLRYGGMGVVRFECAPDGSQMAFVTPGQMHVADVFDGEVASLFGTEFDEYAYFSVNNDGSYVTYATTLYPRQLSLAHMESTRITTISNQTSYAHATSAISPDGSQIIYTTGSSYNQPQLMLIDRAQPDRREPIGFGIAPVWSPDGSMIAYSQHDGVQNDLYLMDVGRRKAVNLTHSEINENGAAWSPDGQTLVFVSFSDYGETRITLMNWDGSDRRDVNALLGHFSPCFVAERPTMLTTAARGGR